MYIYLSEYIYLGYRNGVLLPYYEFNIWYHVHMGKLILKL